MFSSWRFRFGAIGVGLVALTLAAFGGATLASHQFPDVLNSDWFHDDVDWLVDNGITTGFLDGTYRPDNNVTRGQMAAFLHRTGGALVAAGVHVDRDGAGNITIDRWFNNVNGVAPTLSGSNGSYSLDMNFDASQRYVVCTIDTNYVDTRNANCNAGTWWFSPGNERVDVEIWDPEGGYQVGEFNVLVY